MSVPYPTNPYPRAHPDRLQAIAALYGVAALPTEEAVVLELGCGSGGQLIPMAQQLPKATFIGVDIDGEAIKAAQLMCAQLGIQNIQWHCASIADWTAPKADYIIAHGLYSWVPDELRPVIWRLVQGALKANGVLFLSHICLPGGSLRSMARAVMLSAFEADHSEQDNVRAGISALEAAVSLHGVESPLGGALNTTLQSVKTQDWGYVWHDFWVPGYAAFSLEQLNEMAQAHGLQYLNDADIRCNLPMGVPAWLVEKVQATDRLVKSGALLDVYLGRSFRRGLWVHAEQRCSLKLEALDQMFLRAQFELAQTAEGVLLTTEAGQQLGFRGDLAAELTQIMLSEPEIAVSQILGAHPEQTRQWLFSLFAAGAISLSQRKRLQSMPKGQRLEGKQIVVNSFHEPVQLSFFDAALLNALHSGHRGSNLVEALIQSAQAGAFEVRVDGRLPEQPHEWQQVIQGVLPTRMTQLCQKGLWASPHIFEGA